MNSSTSSEQDFGTRDDQELLSALSSLILEQEEVELIRSGDADVGSVLKRALDRHDNLIKRRMAGGENANWALVELDNFKAYGRFGDLMCTAFLQGGFEPHVEQVIFSKLEPGRNFVDVGANLGWHTLNVASEFARRGSGEVFAFEPQPTIFQYLQKSVAVNGFDEIVTLHNVALADREGTIAMQSSSTNAGGAYITGKTEGNKDFIESVDMCTFDSMSEKITDVAVLKIDIEGAEPLFFQRGRRVFRTRKALYCLRDKCRQIGDGLRIFA